MAQIDAVRIGDQLFCKGKTDAWGSVRDVDVDHGRIDAWVENLGDVVLDDEQIVAVHDGKVEVDWDTLPLSLKQAIRHAHDAEDVDA